MGRLKCFDGCPVSLNTKKKMIIPDALKAVRLRPRSKFSILGNIAKECGWTKTGLISQLELKRTNKNQNWYKKKIALIKKNKTVLKNDGEINEINKQLTEYGY